MSNESQTHKRIKNMKNQITIGMMTIMMVLGSTTSFGKTNNSHPRHEQPRTEVRVNKPQPVLSSVEGVHQHQMEPRHEVRPHRHEFGRHHECKICHLTKHQIHKMEKNMHKPVPQPVSHRR